MYFKVKKNLLYIFQSKSPPVSKSSSSSFFSGSCTFTGAALTSGALTGAATTAAGAEDAPTATELNLDCPALISYYFYFLFIFLFFLNMFYLYFLEVFSFQSSKCRIEFSFVDCSWNYFEEIFDILCTCFYINKR